MDIIPIEERNKWCDDFKRILKETDKLSDEDKIRGFRNEVFDKLLFAKSLKYVSQQLTLMDCELEKSENENEILKYKLNNLRNYDENRLNELENKIVKVPSTDQEMRERSKKILIRNLDKMRTLNNSMIKIISTLNG